MHEYHWHDGFLPHWHMGVLWLEPIVILALFIFIHLIVKRTPKK